MEEHSVPGSMVDRSAVNRSVPRGSRPLIRIPRYNFGTIKEREFRWAFVQAAPAKAFSVFPNLLCKQGVRGSNHLTSTSNDLCCIFDYRLPDISRSIRSNNRLGKPDHGDNQKEKMRTSRHPGMVSKPEKTPKFWLPNSVIRHEQAGRCRSLPVGLAS